MHQAKNWDDIVESYERPCVFIRIAYTVGLDGSNLLVLKEQDVKIITDLMMGGDGTNLEGELGELHLSAISEAMNQMMGSAATSLEHISLAKENGYSCIISLFIKSPISILNEILTNRPAIPK